MPKDIETEPALGLIGDEALKRRLRIRKQLLVTPGKPANIAGRDPGWTGGPDFAAYSKDDLKDAAEQFLEAGIEELAENQELLWASDTYSLLIVFQAMDAAGKDSTIKNVMSGVNPQGVHVVGFKRPSDEELDHDFLWRHAKALPERGRIGIFNRSHYEEVLTVRVHPEILEGRKLPPGPRDEKFWQARFDSINEFERHLHHNGTRVIKLFLHVSKKEQKKRFLARLDTPGKEWKFSGDDVRERSYWDDYLNAYEAAITATSTEWAPWFIIPADSKKIMRALVVGVINDTIREMDLRWPKVTPEQRAAHDEARATLEAETD